MLTRRCPLCDSPLESHTCPKCADALALAQATGSDGLDRTLKDPPGKHAGANEGPLGLTPEAERAAWYAAAGKQAPPRDASDEADESSAADRRETPRGFGPAAAILLAQAVAGVLVLAFGGFPDWLDVGVQVVVAAMLLMGVRVARFAVIAAAALHLIKVGIALKVTGSYSVLVSAGPSLCLLGTFLPQMLARGLSAGAGVVFAFAWLATQAVVASQPAGSLADFALEGPEFAEAAEGWRLRVPAGVTLYDGRRMHQAVVGRRAQLLGERMKDELSLRGKRERLLFSNAEGSAAGGLIAEQLPPSIALDTVLPSLALIGQGAERDDSVVPPAILEDRRLESQGWRTPDAGGTRDVLLVKTPDNRAVTVHCLHPAGAGARLCQEIFFGLEVASNL